MRAGFALLALGAGLAALAAATPSVPAETSVRNILFTVDITGSMNVRDYGPPQAPHSRLDAVRRALPALIRGLPCGSRAGLAVFAERQSFTFFRPVEVCANYTPLSQAIERLDWRMGWDGDSRISSGVDSALRFAADDGADLVFLTDGHEAPPLPHGGRKPMRNDGGVGGLIIGVGADRPSPIPRHDERGREIGFYRMEDMVHGSRIGAPSPTASSEPGFHPRNNPYGEADLNGSEHLSALRAGYLEAMASEAGLGFARLEDPSLSARLMTTTRAVALAGHRDLSPLFAMGSLVAAVSALLVNRRPR
ncbi:VWA domain-containing protein [Aureimonas altamirensis]|uniref:vWA domain-containing protein n=1 Tax=Aureimonas altamirensis TaxID=370622 RepID=UPI00203761D9|nr:vWA domain-containing protein [Aureimonas altamirensis]MCM2504629.1 VWA domain-containing protein [Aureimonas altamirensis]